MTQEEFEQELKSRGLRFKRTGDEILVTDQGYGYVHLDSLKSLPPGVRFENQGDVHLGSLKSLPPGVRFENQRDVFLRSLKRVPPDVRFENQGDVLLLSLVGGWFKRWEGNIEGVNPNRLLNLMIKRKIFDK